MSYEDSAPELAREVARGALALVANVKRLEAEIGELSYIAEACRGALQLAPPDHGTVYLAIDRCVAEKLGGVA